MKFETILSVLCERSELRTANDFQQVFVIPAAKEARMAFDVLMAYGFECKLYAEEEQSKLYITAPAADDATVQPRLQAVMLYVNFIARLKQELGALCADNAELLGSPDYTLSFMNLPASGGKQILVNVLPANAVLSVPVSSAQGAVVAQPTAAPATTQQAAANRPKISSKRYSRPKQEETMFSGPSLLSDNNKIISKKEQQKQEADSSWHQFKLYIKGNSAVAFSIIVAMMLMLLTVFSMFVVSKGFLCPDLATVKDKKTWYCK
jgi:hypothetical protein